jgi:hypothetical protein
LKLVLKIAVSIIVINVILSKYYWIFECIV